MFAPRCAACDQIITPAKVGNLELCAFVVIQHELTRKCLWTHRAVKKRSALCLWTKTTMSIVTSARECQPTFFFFFLFLQFPLIILGLRITVNGWTGTTLLSIVRAVILPQLQTCTGNLDISMLAELNFVQYYISTLTNDLWLMKMTCLLKEKVASCQIESLLSSIDSDVCFVLLVYFFLFYRRCFVLFLYFYIMHKYSIHTFSLTRIFESLIPRYRYILRYIKNNCAWFSRFFLL